MADLHSGSDGGDDPILSPLSRPYIKSIHMENFMCHTNFKIDLIKGVNLICGSNGSGKSTILVALMVALGSRAKSTSRGDSLSSLIMNGKNRAYIHVKFHVPWDYIELHEKYGNEVTVSRSINLKGGAKYEVRDYEGHLVRGAGAKEIRNICEQFGIYPDNELAMLSQENAKDFLVHVTAQKKYEKSHRASLQHMIGVNQRMVHTSAEHQQILISQMTSREQHFENLEKIAEHVLENANLHFSKRQRSTDIEMVRDWRDVQKISEHREKLESELAHIQREYEESDTQINAENQESELSQQIQELEREVAESDDLISQFTERQNTAKDLHAENSNLISRVREDITKFDEEYSRLGRNITETEKKAAEHSPEYSDTLRSKMENEQHNSRIKKDDLFQQSNALNHTITDKKKEIETFNQSLKPSMTERAEKTAYSRQIQSEIRDLDSANNNSKNFRNNGDRRSATNETEHHATSRKIVDQFKGWEGSPPVGPLYSYIEMRDDGSEYTPALEKLWATTLQSWWVTTHKDRDALSRMAERVRHGFNPTILVRQDDKFTFESDLPAKSDNYIRIVDVIQVNMDAVLRILVDQNHIEKSVLVPEIETAFAVADKQNVREVLTVSQSRRGETNFQVISKIGSRRDTNFVLPSNMSLSKVGTAARRRLLDREVRDCQFQLRELEVQLNEEQKKLQQLGRENANAERQRSDISQEIQLINSKIDESATEFTRIEAEFTNQDYTVEISNLRSARRQARINYNGAKETEEELIEDARESESEVKSSVDSVQELRRSVRQNKSKLDDLQRNVRRLKREESQRKQQLELKKGKSEKAKVNFENVENEYNEAFESYASKHGDWKNPERMAAENEYFSKSERFLTEEIEKLNSEQSVVQTTKEEVEKAERELEEARENKNKAIARRTEMENWRNLVTTGQRRRVENEQRVWSDIKNNIQKHFQRTLRSRNYTGNVVIDDHRKTLVASASPDAHSAQGTETLSGGEKSLTQIALLMAVWHSMDLGLVAMDEYDVFMDKVNRSISLRCIGETAKSADLQCIIITPQDVDTSALHGIEHVVRRLNPAR